MPQSHPTPQPTTMPFFQIQKWINEETESIVKWAETNTPKKITPETLQKAMRYAARQAATRIILDLQRHNFAVPYHYEDKE